ncbi:MAG: heavy metal-associated domain-containing protein, partial [Candidatus Margulisiibacteriota bacterium]
LIVEDYSTSSVKAISNVLTTDFNAASINAVEDFSLLYFNLPESVSSEHVITQLNKHGFGASQKSDAIVWVKVDGIVCSFCVIGIQKKLSALDSVLTADFNLETGLITIGLKPNQTIDFDLVRSIIYDSGYQVKAIL